jgi:NAD(P)-dependent dehydrogenase (short-subunit alcohol dehydrogenase family)
MFLNSKSTEGKWVLVTGCSSGIGQVAARHLMVQGFNVVASARDFSDVKKLSDAGIMSVRIDTSDLKSIDEGLDDALGLSEGSFYGVFHNAGSGQPGALEDLTVEALSAQYMSNALGAHHINRRLIPLMRQAGEGRIIFNSSVLGVVAMRYRGAYAMSKFAVEAMADTLRLELRGSGIKVVLLQPGPIDTRFRMNSLEAFENEITASQSVHKSDYKKMVERLQKKGKTSLLTLSPHACMSPLLKALKRKNPSSRYRITWATKLMVAIKWLTPSKFLDNFVFKQV